MICINKVTSSRSCICLDISIFYIKHTRIWNSRVKKPSYGLWRHKTELSQIVTSKLIFRNSETLQWKNENKKTELSNSKILLDKKFLSYLTRVFYFLFFYFKISELCNSEVLFSLNVPPTPYRPSKTFFWIKLQS